MSPKGVVIRGSSLAVFFCFSVVYAAWAQSVEAVRRPGAVAAAHHTEAGFRNPGYPPHPGSPGLRIGLPFLLRRVRSTLGWDGVGAPPRTTTDFSALDKARTDGDASVTWVGHSTLLIQLDGVTFLTDPTWSDTASPLPVGPRRFSLPAFPVETLPPIDFVVVSHNHYDHLDLPSLKSLVGGDTRFLVPLGNGELLASSGVQPVTELDWWESAQIKGLRVHAVPARHWSRRGLFDLDRALWSGWVVEGATKRFYFAGDTASFHGFEQIGEKFGRIDLAAVPIGAYLPSEMMAPSHMNPEQAVDALVQLGAMRGVAVHFGTFDLSDEPIAEPPLRFRQASDAAGREDWVLAIGETRLW